MYAVNQTFQKEMFTANEVEQVVNNCPECLSIDPTPIKWKKGNLDCDEVWKRIAIDVTHFGDKIYLSIVDCGPSRYATWSNIPNESMESILRELQKVMRELGPPLEIIVDNYPSFTSVKFKDVMSKWGVNIHYRCANKPSGNSIVERNHRTIKKYAARSKRGIADALFWYNATPMKNGKIPSKLFFNREFRISGSETRIIKQEFVKEKAGYKIDDPVFVKPMNAKCTDKWKEGIVTALPKDNVTIEVNDMPHHMSHVRRKPTDDWTLIGPRGRPVRPASKPDRLGVVQY